MAKMSSKVRMMTALICGVSDRVPVAPDFSCMIPCRLTGKPFWDVLLYNDPPLWQAYLNACDYYGTDAWFIYGAPELQTASSMTTESSIHEENGRLYRRTLYHTPDGDLSSTEVFLPADASTMIEKVIKDIRTDLPKMRHYFADITGYKMDNLRQLREALGDRGLFGVGVATPGLQIWMVYFEGNLEAATYAMYDEPELFAELCDLLEKQQNRIVEICCAEKVESILTGGSGSITLQSPDIWRKLCLPAIQKQTRMCKQAEVISGIHSCGKETYIVETCANETDLNYINPLEIPPMGDCNLSECKKLARGKLALMGNLHTTEVMLRGSTDLVRLSALRAILDAGMDGGFVLSTGDQCGRDTPDENIREMVRVAEEFGYYPLNEDQIRTEILRLERKLAQS